MGFKKIRYNSEEIVKMRIEDATGARVENWTIMMSDLEKLSKLLCRKYGIDYNTGDTKKNKDLDWAM